MEIKELQRIIKDKYYESDYRRGNSGTFLWFIEEIGELATAMAKNDPDNIEEEIVDVLMWLTTIANINDVDLESSIEKYFNNERKNKLSK